MKRMDGSGSFSKVVGKEATRMGLGERETR